MESLESTETSRCGVIDLFPHPPGPLQTCRPTVTLTAAWGGGVCTPEQGQGVSATHHGFASLGWLLTQRPVTSTVAVVCGHAQWAGAGPRVCRPSSRQPSETRCRHHPTFQMRRPRLREAGQLVQGLTSVWAQHGPASPGEAFPELPSYLSARALPTLRQKQEAALSEVRPLRNRRRVSPPAACAGRP